MHIPSGQVCDVLIDKGVEHIYHANSVVTACQFLRINSLLSRGSAERLKIRQTAQDSDGTDKSHGVWFDVFADSVDIHERAKRANVYGPVLFVIDTKIIRNTYTGRLWVTKLNPTKWSKKQKNKDGFKIKQI